MTVALYRAVSRAELDDLRSHGAFRPGPNSMEGKWFSESEAGARRWCETFGRAEGIAYHVVRALVSSELYERLFVIENLDGVADARYVEQNDLPSLRFAGEIGYNADNAGE